MPQLCSRGTFIETTSVIKEYSSESLRELITESKRDPQAVDR